MKTPFLLFVFTAILIANDNLYAQKQFSGWFSHFSTIKTGKKTSFHSDLHWRSTNHWEHMQTLLLRVGLNVHLSSRTTVTGGYAFIQNRRTVGSVSGYLAEHRTWEQFQFNHRFGQFYSSQRFRLEQRFIPVISVVNGELKRNDHFYANRFRYFTRNLLPFHRQTPFRKGAYGVLQNEVFLNFGNTENLNGKIFDQNRFYAALGYRISPHVDMETGYVNQYINGRASSFTNNHIVQLAGYLRL